MRGEGVKGHRVHRVIHRAHERCAVVPPLGEVERHHLPGRVHALVRPARAPNGHGPPADLFKRLLELALHGARDRALLAVAAAQELSFLALPLEPGPPPALSARALRGKRARRKRFPVPALRVQQ
jgi:hypothetical protein